MVRRQQGNESTREGGGPCRLAEGCAPPSARIPPPSPCRALPQEECVTPSAVCTSRSVCPAGAGSKVVITVGPSVRFARRSGEGGGRSPSRGFQPPSLPVPAGSLFCPRSLLVSRQRRLSWRTFAYRIPPRHELTSPVLLLPPSCPAPTPGAVPGRGHAGAAAAGGGVVRARGPELGHQRVPRSQVGAWLVFFSSALPDWEAAVSLGGTKRASCLHASSYSMCVPVAGCLRCALRCWGRRRGMRKGGSRMPHAFSCAHVPLPRATQPGQPGGGNEAHAPAVQVRPSEGAAGGWHAAAAVVKPATQRCTRQLRRQPTSLLYDARSHAPPALALLPLPASPTCTSPLPSPPLLPTAACGWTPRGGRWWCGGPWSLTRAAGRAWRTTRCRFRRTRRVLRFLPFSHFSLFREGPRGCAGRAGRLVLAAPWQRARRGSQCCVRSHSCSSGGHRCAFVTTRRGPALPSCR